MGKRQRSVLGQNFLADWGAQQRIAAALGEAGRGDVVEIGSGKAAITALLAERARRLVAIEVDPAFAGALRTRFSGVPSVEIVEADVLTVDFTALAREGGGRWRWSATCRTTSHRPSCSGCSSMKTGSAARW